MHRALVGILVLAFLAIDWLIFHDALKPERYTAVEYMTGLVSIPTLGLLVRDFVRAS
jgi:hypothetical protein